jgi:hypothetical protein
MVGIKLALPNCQNLMARGRSRFEFDPGQRQSHTIPFDLHGLGRTNNSDVPHRTIPPDATLDRVPRLDYGGLACGQLARPRRDPPTLRLWMTC